MSTKNISIVLLLMTTLLALPATHAADEPERVQPCRQYGRSPQCVVVPMASAEDDASGKAFAPASVDRALLYLVRPYLTDSRNRTIVMVDGKLAGHLAPNTYTLLELAPGSHRISLYTEHELSLTVELAAGESRFMEYHLSRIFGDGSGELINVNGEQGREAIRRAKRAALVAAEIPPASLRAPAAGRLPGETPAAKQP